jgi:hypothetical protein
MVRIILWRHLPIVVIFGFAVTGLKAQEPKSVIDNIFALPSKAQSKIDKAIADIDGAFEKEMAKQIGKLQKQEKKIYKKLHKKDTALANNYLLQSRQAIAQLNERLSNTHKVSVYIASLDTLQTAFTFLGDSSLSSLTGKQLHATKASLLKINHLQNQVQQSEELKKFLQRRRDNLKEQLLKFGLIKELKRINKQVYYYAQQIKEYKEMLNDPKRMGAKTIEMLCKNKLFKEFLQSNSLLAGLFPSANGGSTPNAAFFLAANPNLQTRTMLNDIVQQQIATGGPNALASFQQNLQDAQAQITQLTDKIQRAGLGSSGDELPNGFKPNKQKTKTFLQRLEYSTNVQTQKANSYFPVTSDIALSVGYKLNDKSIVGIGMSFKVGFGRGWDDIQLSSQGIGLRSFIDWKIKTGFYLSGGYEQNYRNAIAGFNQLRNLSTWQQSGLVGISKVVPLKTKFFKKTNIKLLWDFLSYKQTPRVQPWVFRIGYSFN